MRQIKIDKSIRLIELFGGYGSQALALKKIGVDFERYKLVELDKYAIKSYNAIHNTSFEPLDITKIHGKDLEIVDTDKYCYMVTYSYPCTSISLAGKQEGMVKGSGTASSLLWEVQRLLWEIKNDNCELPQILFMENVKQVLSAKNKAQFDEWRGFLESLGYTNTHKVLNAKDYGIPQNRERCFMFSFLGNYNYHFPKPIPLTCKAKDLLENNVDEKYYIKTDNAKRMLKKLIADGKLKETSVWDKSDNEPKERSISNALLSREDRGISHHKQEGTTVIERYVCDKCTNDPRIKDVANCVTAKDYGIVSRKGSENAVIEVKQSENIIGQIPCKFDKNNGNGFKSINEATVRNLNAKVTSTVTARYYKGISANNDNMVICAMRGRNPNNPSDRTAGILTEQRLEPNLQGTSNALTTVQKDNLVLEKEYPIGSIAINAGERFNVYMPGDISKCLKANKHDIGVLLQGPEESKGAVYHSGFWYRIRKLTPKECGRLMGVSDGDIDKMMAVNSNTQLYKQFGNSIVINCMIEMFNNLNFTIIKGE